MNLITIKKNEWTNKNLDNFSFFFFQFLRLVLIRLLDDDFDFRFVFDLIGGDEFGIAASSAIDADFEELEAELSALLPDKWLEHLLENVDVDIAVEVDWSADDDPDEEHRPDDADDAALVIAEHVDDDDGDDDEHVE